MSKFRTVAAEVLIVLLSAQWSLATGDAPAHLGAGLKLFDIQRYSEAAKEFELALEADPGLQDARYHLALCEFNQRHFPEAGEQFERLAQTGYEKRWVTYYLGRIDLIAGRLDLAIQRFQSLRSSEPLQDESRCSHRPPSAPTAAPIRRTPAPRPRRSLLPARYRAARSPT